MSEITIDCKSCNIVALSSNEIRCEIYRPDVSTLVKAIDSDKDLRERVLDQIGIHECIAHFGEQEVRSYLDD